MNQKSKEENPCQVYISLKEAGKYSGYSQGYLNLRIRQGKLKGSKIGRSWITTKEWVDDYIKRVNEYKNHLTDTRIKKMVEAEMAKKERKSRKETMVEFKASEILSTSEIEEIKKELNLLPHLIFRCGGYIPGRRWRAIAVACALAFILFSAGFIFSYPYFEQIFNPIKNFVSDIPSEIPLVISESINETTNKINGITSKVLNIGRFKVVRVVPFDPNFIIDVTDVKSLSGYITEKIDGTTPVAIYLTHYIKNIFDNLGYNLAFYISYDMQGIEKIESMKKMGDMEKIVRETFCDNLARSRQIVTDFWRDAKGIVGNIKGDIIGNIKGNIKGIGNIKGNVKERILISIERTSESIIENSQRFIADIGENLTLTYQGLSKTIKKIPQKIIFLFKKEEKTFTKEELEKLTTENLLTKQELQELKDELERLKEREAETQKLIQSFVDKLEGW